jgi:hypothetical protein
LERLAAEEEAPVVRTWVGIDLIRVLRDPNSLGNVLIHPRTSVSALATLIIALTR